MKKLLFSAMMLAVLAVGSCSKESLPAGTESSRQENAEVFSVDRSVVTLDAEGTPQQLTLSGAARCMVYGDLGRFFSISHEASSAPGVFTVTVVAAPNTTGKTRSAQAALTDGSSMVWITVNQNG